MIQTLPVKKDTSLASYPVLLKRVRQTIAQGKERALDAVEREKVRTCWETGKLIREHVLLNKDRAAYGGQVLKKLSKDLSVDPSELGRMVEFARTYPISVPGRKLSWSHYKALLAVNDDKEREVIAQQALRQSWTRETLRRKIKSLNANSVTARTHGAKLSQTVETAPGTPGVYRIYQLATGELAVDLGFSNHYRPQGPFRFKEGDIVSSAGSALKRSDISSDMLFTYTAKVLEIIDADTLKAQVDLGFGFSTNQKLRLRGLDAPEIISREGLKAKAFVQKLLKGKTILIKTTKSDKYDRYLADVWAGGIHLNQALLTKGLAKKAAE